MSNEKLCTHIQSNSSNEFITKYNVSKLLKLLFLLYSIILHGYYDNTILTNGPVEFNRWKFVCINNT